MKNIIEPDFVPKRATHKSAGYDIYVTKEVNLKPGEFTIIDTGVVFEDKDNLHLHKYNCVVKNMEVERGSVYQDVTNYVGLIFPRSSYGFKYGLRFANSICVIDQDYRNTIKLSVTVDKEIKLVAGERIAQLIFVPYLTLYDEIPPTEVRTGGIGSTGN